MMTLWAMGSMPAHCENAAVEFEPSHEPRWVVDPAAPGPDTPSVGASLFDEITLLPDGRREVPFPFDQLIQRFEAAAGCDATASCVRSVLLPLGRSLQRVAASPDYFRFPRIVSGVVADGRGPWLLRDRLYVGYQERAGIVEVISYNEAAARFEFQQVKNYRAGAQPQVFQARRTVCLTCHQNHAPIFPRQVWDETNANPALAAKLGAERQSYFGVATRGSTDIANALDDATDRSNRLALMQRLWREGCGDGDQGSRCRAAAFTAALQFVLTERRAYDDNVAVRTACSETLQRSARRLWPGGLAMPNPDLANRDPLAASGGSDSLAAAHVPAQLDPLSPKPALETLPSDGGRLATLLITAIADSLPTAGVDKLSAALSSRAHKSPPRMRTHRGRCDVRTTAAITRFDCTGGVELRGTLAGSFATVDALRVGSGDVLRNLRLPARHPNAQTLSLTPRIRVRALRLPDGNAVTEIRVDSQSGVTMTVTEDFKMLEPAVAEALASTPQASHATRLTAVIAALKGERIKSPSYVEISLPQVEPVATSPDAIALTAPFESRCGSCHHTADVSPPNFLSGDAARVKQALQSCAPRIFVRLAMNDLPPVHRQKTPMPPERFVASGQDTTDLRLLRLRVESLLKVEHGRVPSVSELLLNGYESLRSCLPDGLPESQP